MTLAESYDYCRKVTRTRARNFYYAFVLLDRPRRDAICSIYAFMRRCDDITDEVGSGSAGERRKLLDDWRGQMESALDGRMPEHKLWPAFAETAARYHIPKQYFHEMVDGVGSDLDRNQVETYAELARYCYQVASVAGLSAIHIFGFQSPDAPALAEKCGIAFQLTNILRDVREDALAGRVYLPREDMDRFGVRAEELTSGPETDRFRQLMRFETVRARRCYEESRPLVGMVDPSCRRALSALIRIYETLLDRIAEADYNVLRQRVRLSAMEKTWILVRAFGHASPIPRN